MTTDLSKSHSANAHQMLHNELKDEYALFHQRWMQFIFFQAILFASTALFVFGNIPELGVYVALGSFCIIGALSALYAIMTMAVSLNNIASRSRYWKNRIAVGGDPDYNMPLLGCFPNQALSRVSGMLILAIPLIVTGLWLIVLATITFEKLRLVWL